jgi:small subunit ribosomal protein S9
MPKTKKTEKKEKPSKEGKSPAEQPKKKIKRPAVKKAVEKLISTAKTKLEKYYEAEGRRKTAVARIRLFTLKANTQKETPEYPTVQLFLVNEKPLEQYFSIPEFQQIAQSSLERMKCLDKFRVSARVQGGGLKAQAEAVRHGTARALVLFNPDFRKRLKAAGFLTRDPRMRERKKFGLKRARRAPQWSKR